MSETLKRADHQQVCEVCWAETYPVFCPTCGRDDYPSDDVMEGIVASISRWMGPIALVAGFAAVVLFAGPYVKAFGEWMGAGW